MAASAPQDSTAYGLDLPSNLEKKLWFRAAMLVVVALVILLPRARGLGIYGTADEPNYLKYSASFYYLLHEGRYGETDLIVHPGVTDLWSGALAFWLYLPDYVDDPQADFPLPDLYFKQIIERAEMNKEMMLALSRRFVVGFQTILLVAAFAFGWQAFGFSRALLGVLLVSFDPFFFANSRILQPDGFLSTAMFLGLVALLAYVRRRSKWALLVSAVAAGLGILSKVPGVFLLPVAGLVLAADWWWGQGTDRRQAKGLGRLLGVYLLWLAVVALTIFLLWPSMWVQPMASFQELLDFTL
ncbi:MAG: phospholipid carrier-dependent glycosyltransferase, partial [Anaerolineales bacterium]